MSLSFDMLFKILISFLTMKVAHFRGGNLGHTERKRNKNHPSSCSLDIIITPWLTF